MKIHKPLDYAEHIIQARMCIFKIENNMNQREIKAALLMVKELKLLTELLEKSIQAQK